MFPFPFPKLLLRVTVVVVDSGRVRSSREGQVGLARVGMVGGKGEIPMRRRSRAKSMSGGGGEDDWIDDWVEDDSDRREREGDEEAEVTTVGRGVCAWRVYWGHWGWWSRVAVVVDW